MIARFLDRPELAKLLLRLAAGVIMLLHGIYLVQYGVADIKAMTTKAGLPELLSYGIYLGEFVAPILLIIGFQTRIAGLVYAFNMLMSIVIAHSAEAFQLNGYGGWAIEFNVLLMSAGLVISLLGAGKYSIDRK